MSKIRLDKVLVTRGIVETRSQAENYIKLGKVKINGLIVTKAGFFVKGTDKIELAAEEKYVSRAALKLASVAEKLNLDFSNKTVLDVGSSTGGFTDYALRHGAEKVIAVDVGTGQLHPSLRAHPRIELYEKTDIRDFKLVEKPDVVLVDVSFISLREVLPAVARLGGKKTRIIALLKPQFEAGKAEINRGVVKNDTLRRKILKEFEEWAKTHFVIAGKADSTVAGAHGNRERFYLLRPKP